MVKEAEFAYKVERGEVESIDEYGKRFREKEQGDYTLEDYYLIPDDRRVELIDGKIYDMTAPRASHQMIAGEIYRQLSNCRIEHEMTCLPMIGPMDVQLDRDEKTMVQPDVLILCDMSKLITRCVYGAPEFVLEVLSSSTRSKDQIVKLKKYMEAGCREYWVVDKENEKVTVYDFETKDWPKIYSFDDKVPVGVSEGLCKIDFPMIKVILERFPVREEAEE